MLALLTEEQEMLQATATAVAGTARIRHPSDCEKVDRAAVWSSLADAGLLGLRTRAVAAPAPGSGVEVMVVAEALGAALAPLPYLGSAVLATELLALAGAPEAWLEDTAAGRVRCAPLLTADLTRLASAGDPSSIAWDADGASFALAWEGDPGERRLVRLPVGDDWHSAGSADLTRVMLAPPPALEGEPVGRPLDPEQFDRWLALALVAASADAVGAMRQGLMGVVAYTKERVQYGVPVGSFQAVQHLCAEALVAVEGAASTVKYAAWAADELEPADALLAARTAKAYSGLTARTVPETIMQVYGGIGQTWEHIAHFVNRRAMVDRLVLGDDTTQLARIADARLGATSR